MGTLKGGMGAGLRPACEELLLACVFWIFSLYHEITRVMAGGAACEPRNCPFLLSLLS